MGRRPQFRLFKVKARCSARERRRPQPRAGAGRGWAAGVMWGGVGVRWAELRTGPSAAGVWGAARLPLPGPLEPALGGWVAGEHRWKKESRWRSRWDVGGEGGPPTWLTSSVQGIARGVGSPSAVPPPTPRMHTPVPGREALEMGPPPAPAPSRQLPHSARPRCVSGRSFLPLPLRRERRVWGGDCHSPLRALDQYRSLGAAGAGSWSAAGGPERRARGPRAVQSAVPARGCRGSGDATPAPGV